MRINIISREEEEENQRDMTKEEREGEGEGRDCAAMTEEGKEITVTKVG